MYIGRSVVVVYIVGLAKGKRPYVCFNRPATSVLCCLDFTKTWIPDVAIVGTAQKQKTKQNKQTNKQKNRTGKLSGRLALSKVNLYVAAKNTDIKNRLVDF